MNKKVLGCGIAAIVVVVLVGIVLVVFGISQYEKCVGADETVIKATGDTDAQLQRRFDLVPNLVASVKGGMDFEKSTLTAVTEARAKVSQLNLNMKDVIDDPAKMQQFAAAQNQLGGALSRLLVTVEKYPDLKANEQVRDLMTQLEGTENRISVARQRYNESVMECNKLVRGPVSGIFARWANAKYRQPFEASAEAKTTVPQVKL
jgi:LemA protein